MINRTPSNSKKIEQLKLSSILGLIFLASFLAFSAGEEQTLLSFMRWYTGIFLLTFAAFKLFDYKMFILIFSAYDIIAKRFKLYAYVYPFILLGLAGLYFVDVLPIFRNFATLIVALVVSIGVFQDAFLSGNKSSCGILGKIIKLPYTTVSFIENAALFGMAAVTLAYYE